MESGHINWKSFSPHEFELLVRDLLSACENIPVESFGVGTDGGIDLRKDRCRTIIQCKRYCTDFRHLKRELAKEAKKEAVRCAERYIVATSLSLTPRQKKSIKELIPNIRTEEDILSGDDLENRLVLHPEIRKLYPLLWLGDADFIRDTLEKAQDRAIDHDSACELEKIARCMGYVAKPPMAAHALEILKEHKALIITGKPGIGKTTLAYYLTAYLMQEADYEFVFIREDITTARYKFRKDKAQIFLYDDFLGTTFLHDRLRKNENKSIADFIEQVSDSANKLIVFTTREYIYQQASCIYSEFDDPHARYRKLLLNIEQQDLQYKAEIFYKHLWHKSFPAQYIKALFLNSQGNDWATDAPLFRILRHPSFNPRILERALQDSLRRQVEDVHDFPDFILRGLNSPYFLYEHAFREQLSQEQQILLLMVGVHPEWSPLDMTLKAATHFIRATGRYQGTPVRDSLRVLIGDFLTTRRNYQGQTEVNFVNPGIRDFIHQYLYNNADTAHLIIEHTDNCVQPTYLLSLLYRLRHKEPQQTEDTGLSKELSLHLRANVHRLLEARVADGHSDLELTLLAAAAISHGAIMEGEKVELIGKLLEQEAARPNLVIEGEHLHEYGELFSHVEGSGHAEKIPWDSFLHAILESNDNLDIFDFLHDYQHLFSPSLLRSYTITSSMETWWDNYRTTISQQDLSVIEEEGWTLHGVIRDFPDGFCGLNFNRVREFLDEEEAHAESKEEEARDWELPETNTPDHNAEENILYIKHLFETLAAESPSR